MCYKHICVLFGSLGKSPWGMANVFSMAVGTIGEWLKVVPFIVRDTTVWWRGGREGAGSFLKNKYPGRQTP